MNDASSGAPPGAAQPTPGPADDNLEPIERVVADVVERLRILSETPDAKLTCNSLIELIGPGSHALAILIFSLLNLLPGPPGYSVVIGLAIIAFSIMMVSGVQMRLWDFFGNRQLPLKLLLKVLGMMQRFTKIVAKFSTPRLAFLTGAAATPIIGFFGIVMGAGMLVPIPFTNTLPSIGMAIVCVAVLNRDGVAAIAGAIVGVFGLAVLATCIWLAFVLVFVVGEVIVEEIDELLH
ncbi:hypothetical protein VW29_05985 [Devosia limi DSM 17137]|uniref:Uncharacterized conserved protein n=1 Tax=Devosia limi DSM 17137 TaxID=1121477 RepID=A0A0F5LU74_9HYPH|nr:exopolysaccharide biosynthesis protein [Devosia limi]KKB85836.1 hypothetical protein VW29_05985 [Devosia limi DSM 17137]SHE34962.1 Uncharacterized conserved protein [Devosia limi DSM 17137]